MCKLVGRGSGLEFYLSQDPLLVTWVLAYHHLFEAAFILFLYLFFLVRLEEYASFYYGFTVNDCFLLRKKIIIISPPLLLMCYIHAYVYVCICVYIYTCMYVCMLVYEQFLM